MSGEQDEGQEKSHDPTPRRLEKAREQGNVARSQDAQTLAAYLGLGVVMSLGVGWAAQRIGNVLKGAIAYPEDLARQFLHGGASEIALAFAWAVAGPAAIFVILPAGFILALLFAQRSIIFAPDKIAAKLSRISPVSNAKQKFGPKGLVEFAKSVVKVGSLSVVLTLALTAQADQIARFAHIPARQVGLLLSQQFWLVMTGVMVVAAILAFVDVLWQRHSHLRDNMMTHQDLKEETKQSEGDPQLRASRRERARQIANNQMLQDIPKADVLIVNPIHFAVALKWDRRPGTVPRCLGKGVDHMALAMRSRAEGAGVPIHEDPPTARALYGGVEVGQEIIPEHYKAVAAAIVFADKLRIDRRRMLFGDGSA